MWPGKKNIIVFPEQKNYAGNKGREESNLYLLFLYLSTV